MSAHTPDSGHHQNQNSLQDSGRISTSQKPQNPDTELTDEEILELEDKVGGGGRHGSKAPRQAKNFWPSAGRMLKLLTPYTWLLAAVGLLIAGSVALNVIAPRAIGAAMDIIFSGIISARMPAGVSQAEVEAGLRASGQNNYADMLSGMEVLPGQGINFERLGRVVALILLMYLGASLLMWAQAFIMNRIVMRVIYNLRRQVEDKLGTLPLRYFDQAQRGDILSRTTNDVDNVQQTLQQSLSQTLQSLLLLIGITGMMFSVSWQLALVTLLTIPLTGIVVGIIGKRSQREFRSQWASTGRLNGQVEEAFSGFDVLLLFGAQEESLRTFTQHNQTVYRSSATAQTLSGLMMPLMQFISYLSYVAIAVLGGLKVAQGSMTLGGATAFIQYSRQFNQPLSQLSGMAQMLQSGVASAERIFELLDAEDESPDTHHHSLLGPSPCGDVRFENVDFSYTEEPLIEDVNLHIQPGETAAIVGPTGAGKTTLVNLILRFYELTSGHIYIDGQDIAQMSRKELRSHVGMVLQDAVLFEGTIMENIRYGRLDATDEEVVAAAKATYVDRFVRSLPEGYDTRISQDDGPLSAGERQLITIARAFVAQPALLILDEATSSVDTRTEVLVQRAMAALQQGRTSFVIAHRLSTIRGADVILVMEEGRIVESGTHEELLERRGAYYKLYQSQFTTQAS